MALLYGCAGHLTDKNGGFRPGQHASTRRPLARAAVRALSGRLSRRPWRFLSESLLSMALLYGSTWRVTTPFRRSPAWAVCWQGRFDRWRAQAVQRRRARARESRGAQERLERSATELSAELNACTAWCSRAWLGVHSARCADIVLSAECQDSATTDARPRPTAGTTPAGGGGWRACARARRTAPSSTTCSSPARRTRRSRSMPIEHTIGESIP
jgi:hypothetical protein